MNIKVLFIVIVSSLLFVSCSTKIPIRTSSATILFKTPSMKFYDLGFIRKYDNYIELNILNAGNSILRLNIYKNKICKSTLQCISSKEFNQKYLSTEYNEQFLYNLFNQNKIDFKDKKNRVHIKVKFN